MKRMNTSQTGYSIGQARSWEDEVNLSAPGSSDWIIIPEKVRGVSVTVSFTGGATGKMQATTDRVNTIETGTPVAVDWPFGIVSVTTQRRVKACSGLRAVQVGTGTMKVTFRGQ
jgi:hypothetical protein